MDILKFSLSLKSMIYLLIVNASYVIITAPN
nr:MAG TPA: hypothetical protein [Caudoviricetes sp.]